MKKYVLPFMLALPFAFSSPAMAGERELPGDIVTALMPFMTWGITRIEDDPEGTRQWLRSTGASLVVNNALRLGFNETRFGERPNGNPYGFPSGHTGFVVSHSAFLQDRYGWKYGLPATLASAYVAWLRVDTDHHHYRDVIAAAAVSYSVSKFFVTPEDATFIAPVIGPDWLGFRWQRSF